MKILSEMEDELEEEERKRTCDICDKRFTNAEELNNHLPLHHQFQQETRCDSSGGEGQSHYDSQSDLQSFNDPLSMGGNPTQEVQKSDPAPSHKTTDFNKSKLSLEDRKLSSRNEIRKDVVLRNTEVKNDVDNVKDEALWDILEVKMEPEEEHVEEYKHAIPKQKYNKLKKFEGKLFRFESKSSWKIILKSFRQDGCKWECLKCSSIYDSNHGVYYHLKVEDLIV